MVESQGQKNGLTGMPKLTTSQILKSSQDWLTGARRMLTKVIPTPKALRASEDWDSEETSLQKGIMFSIGSGLFNLILWGLWV